MGFSAPAVHAQEGQASVKIQPSIIEQNVSPGSKISQTLRLTNISSETRVFLVVKEDITGLTSDGHPIFAGPQEKTGYEVSSWITVSEDTVTLAPGQMSEIPITIEVPTNASPGGHFGAVFFKLKTERPTETGTGVGYQIGTVVSLRVAGEVVESASIREFFSDKLLYDSPEVQFTVTVKNSGNALVRPRGPLEIVDMFGKKVAMLVVNDSAAAVLPDDTRSFEVSWKGEGFVFGRHTALVSLVYGEDSRDTISHALSFWVLPLRLIAWTGIILIGIIAGIIMWVRMSVRRKMREMAGTRMPVGYAQTTRPFSRLAFVALVLLVATLLFVGILFVLFA